MVLLQEIWFQEGQGSRRQSQVVTGIPLYDLSDGPGPTSGFHSEIGHRQFTVFVDGSPEDTSSRRLLCSGPNTTPITGNGVGVTFHEDSMTSHVYVLVTHYCESDVVSFLFVFTQDIRQYITHVSYTNPVKLEDTPSSVSKFSFQLL